MTMSESTTMSAMHTKDGAPQTSPDTAAFLSAIAMSPKTPAARVRKHVVGHWAVQHPVQAIWQLIWNVIAIRRFNIA
jgi:hypothetical protein